MHMLSMKNGSNEIYRALFEKNGTAMLVINSEAVIVLANKAFVKLSGYPKAALESCKKWTEIHRLDGEKGTAPHEATLVDCKGREIPALLTVSPLVMDGLSIVSVVKRPRNIYAERLLTKYQLLFDSVRDIVLIVNADGRVIGANQAAVQSYGYSKEELQSMSLCELRQSASSTAVQKYLFECKFRPTLFEVNGLRKDGSTFQMEVKSCSANVMGKLFIISVGRDITERKLYEKHLHEAQKKTQALIKAIPDSLFRIGRDGTIYQDSIHSDSALYTGKKATGKNIADVLPRQTAKRLARGIGKVLRTHTLVTLEFQYSNGELPLFLEVRLAACGDDEVMAIVRDITDRKEMEDQLRYMSFHDALTGLYNRAYFEQEMARLQMVRQVGAGLVMCDVDGLKLINDSLGHLAGDQVLKEVAQIIKSTFRASDIVARIGGDEFAVLLQEQSVVDCAKICKRINRKVARYNVERELMPIGLAIGYAVNKTASDNLDELLKEADNRMYRQKLHHHESSKSAIVDALIKALQTRDHITDGHAERLEGLVTLLAESVGISHNIHPDLALFARFHDLGKVGIPDHILFKPARLTDKEFVIMKQHSEIGYRIALSIPDLQPIAEWILHHHEWWCGQGYPGGLQKHEIPIECRILTIVDAYDAMTNNRPYHKAMSRKQAVIELERCSGTQFDPELVRSFVKLI